MTFSCEWGKPHISIYFGWRFRREHLLLLFGHPGGSPCRSVATRKVKLKCCITLEPNLNCVSITENRLSLTFFVWPMEGGLRYSLTPYLQRFYENEYYVMYIILHYSHECFRLKTICFLFETLPEITRDTVSQMPDRCDTPSCSKN